jgi:hypothetical protein
VSEFERGRCVTEPYAVHVCGESATRSPLLCLVGDAGNMLCNGGRCGAPDSLYASTPGKPGMDTTGRSIPYGMCVEQSEGKEFHYCSSRRVSSKSRTYLKQARTPLTPSPASYTSLLQRPEVVIRHLGSLHRRREHPLVGAHLRPVKVRHRPVLRELVLVPRMRQV